MNGLLENVPIDKVGEFEEQLLQMLQMKYQKEVLDELRQGKLTDDVSEKLTQCAKEVADSLSAVK